MDLHMREFNGTTFGMSVEASSPAFKRMKKNAFTGKIKPRGSWVERSARCVQAADVAAVLEGYTATGIEVTDEYARLARERIAQELAQAA